MFNPRGASLCVKLLLTLDNICARLLTVAPNIYMRRQHL